MTAASVSVVIPCYCCAHTIERAVESVLNQSRPVSQIILINDASRDETLAKLYDIQARHASGLIQIVDLKQNLGVASARNAGLDVATQNYVAFLDADDAWHPNKIAIQYQWMLDHPSAALCAHSSIYLDEAQQPPPIPANWVSSLVLPRQLLFSNRLPTRAVMLKRALPYRFKSGKRYAEDYLLWLTIVMNGHETWLLHLPLAFAFKDEYGESGLSSHMWPMEQGVLDTFKQLYNLKLISFMIYAVAALFSLLKFFRRLFLVKFRTI